MDFDGRFVNVFEIFAEKPESMQLYLQQGQLLFWILVNKLKRCQKKLKLIPC